MDLQKAVSIANVCAGFVAAASLIYAVYLAKKQDRKERKDAAGKVVAWAVASAIEGDQAPPDDNYRGVVFVNNTDEVLYDVDVATTQEDSNTTRRSEKVENRGADAESKRSEPERRRFKLIPPGVHFLYRDDKNDRGIIWEEPRPVDGSNSCFRVSIRDENDQVEQRNLISDVHTENPRRVESLRYRVANSTWHRDRSGTLKRVRWWQWWHKERKAPKKESGYSPTDLQHQPNENAQKLIEQLFARLTQPNTDNTPNTVAAAAADIVSSGIARVRRTQGRGQGIFLMTQSDEDWPRFYISAGRSGKNLEAFPNDGLQFHSAKGAKVERIPVSEFSAMSDPKASDWLGKDQIEELVTILKREFKAHLKNPT